MMCDKKEMPEIQAILFDMDGVLIFSEPFWKEAEQTVFKKYFGISLSYEDVCLTTGLKTTEVVDIHKRRYGIDCDTLYIGHEIEKEVVRLVQAHGQPMPGLQELTGWIQEKNWRRCLVTSSSPFVYKHIVQFVQLEDFFEKKFTAYDEEWGKPDPAVYHSACSYLNIAKENIVVIEDSLNGVKSAFSAGLSVLGLPEKHMQDHPEYRSRVIQTFNSHFEILDFLKSNC